MADKVHYIRTKRTDRVDWFLAGFPDRDGVYFAKGFIYSQLGNRYAKVYEGRAASVKPILAKQILEKQPGHGYASTGWMNYLNTKVRDSYGENVLGSFGSALALFEAQYGFEPKWLLVFSVVRKRN